MTKEQLEALKNYIDAKILELIEQGFGRDSSHEYLRRRELEDDLASSFNLKL